ncbi:hypothetical protein HED96_000618 [Salmonella enterica]|nr:hypothetical protein [Salmonella enterica]EKS2390049.1 hypothetical protein [Salmonella enterica]ELO0592914.1 hypothetical protein [Salmonella enterica]HCM6305240.1 hypothetical protein [Salmonella enterica subsp. enterica serovar 6,14:y:1,7]
MAFILTYYTGPDSSATAQAGRYMGVKARANYRGETRRDLFLNNATHSHERSQHMLHGHC